MQKILHSIGSLPNALIGSTKVLLVCDASFPFLNIKEKIESISIPYVKFDQFTPNPLYEDVCKGVDMFNRTRCDTILAVGGGSAIDVAKCIKLYCKMPVGTLYLEQPYEETGVKLVAIPTTAGTGSESTRYAVIYYDGKKQSVTHDSIIPDIAILEPAVLKTLPLYQKKCTMLDALCQGIESWWSVNSTDESKAYSKIAVETIIYWWHEYIFERSAQGDACSEGLKNTEESAVHIMQAANYAGRAICITQTTAAHAFSYKITSLYKLPHGHAVAVSMAEIWEYMLAHPEKCIDSRGQEYLQQIYKDIAAAFGVENPYAARDIFICMLKDMAIQNPVSSDRASDISLLTSSVNPIRLRNNPVELDEQTIRRLYDAIVK